MQTISDDDLTFLAETADPDPVVDPDAPSLDQLLGTEREGLLPSWYMAAPMAAGGVRPRWHRVAAIALIAAFLLITGLGLCNTYGDLISS